MTYWPSAICLFVAVIGLMVTPVTSCAGHVNLTAVSEPTSLYSTNYPQSYNNPAACSWRIISQTAGARIYVEIVDVVLENSSNCSDNLAIYDDFNSGGKLLLRVCGQVKPSLLKSSPGGSINIYFSSDGVRASKGFALRFWTVEEGSSHPSCVPGGRTSVAVGVTPQRLDLPDIQAGSSDCDFQLEADNGYVLILKAMPETDVLDCEVEFIKVYDGSSPSGPSVRLLCTEAGFTSYRSSGSSLYLQTSLAQSRRLSLMVYREPMKSAECSTTVFPQIDALFRPLYVWIPYAHDTSGQPCPVSAGVRSAGSSSSLRVTVLGSSSLTSLNCSINYIQVSSYSDTLFFLHKPKCTSGGLPYYTSSDPSLVLGQAIEEVGEKYLVEIQSQGYTCRNDTKMYETDGEDPVTVSLDIPVLSRSIPCTFRFKALRPGYLVKMVFTGSNLEKTGRTCTDEYFRVYDGYNQSSYILGAYCGHGWSRPLVFTSTSGELFVELVTKTTGRLIHVEMGYSSFEDNRCDGTLNLESMERDQIIESPAFPNYLARNLQCLYLITSLGGNSIILDAFDFSFPSDCSDNLTVFDGGNITSPVLGVWCASNTNTTLVTSGTTVLMMLSTSSHSTNSRFSVRYSDNAPKFGSPEDPRVAKAIAAIVGLANGVGGVFLLVFAICYCRNKDLKQEDEKTLEEKLEDMREDQEEAAEIEKGH